MRTVLYTEDLQPIAIVELTPNEEEIVTQGGSIRLAYIPPMKIVPYSRFTGASHTPLTDVSVYGEWVSRRSVSQLILFARADLFKPQTALQLSGLSP